MGVVMGRIHSTVVPQSTNVFVYKQSGSRPEAFGKILLLFANPESCDKHDHGTDTNVAIFDKII